MLLNNILKLVTVSTVFSTLGFAQSTISEAPTRRRMISPAPVTAPGVPEKTIIPTVDDRIDRNFCASLSFDGRAFLFRPTQGKNGPTLIRDDNADVLDPSILRAYPDGVCATLRWSAPIGSRVRATVKSDPHHVIGRGMFVIGGLDEGSAVVMMQRGSWASAGPIYVEVEISTPGGATTLQWRSDLFLLIKMEDKEEALQYAARNYFEHWPQLAKNSQVPPPPQMQVITSGASPAFQLDTRPFFARNLTLGSRGADVEEWQNFLASKGFLIIGSGVQRGYFGALTRSATAAWQKARGISPPQGYFGPISRVTAENDILEMKRATLTKKG